MKRFDPVSHEQAAAIRAAALAEFYMVAWGASRRQAAGGRQQAAEWMLSRADLSDILTGLLTAPDVSKGPIINMLDLTAEGNVNSYAPFGGPSEWYISPLIMAHLEQRMIMLVQAADGSPMVRDMYALLKYAQWLTQEMRRVAPKHLPIE